MTEELKLPERFQIDQEIGRGGMAVVYRAHDRHLDRFVAIKVLSPFLSHQLGIERFQREIALMAKLVHPGIVALFDSGQVDGRLYYVMPYVAGENLRARLSRERRMSMEDAAGMGADVAEALAYAHGAGIVHRDIKPENIFTVGGRAVLADFGIAHLVSENPRQSSNLTSAGMILGTPAYMSPEQATGEIRIDGRSDLYSLGCVLYELVTGAVPFTGNTPMAVLNKHFTEQPQPPSERSSGLSRAFDETVLQLLAKEPDQRPATAGEVAKALRSVHITGEVTPVTQAPSDADRLVQEALQAIYRSISAGPAARSHLDQASAYLKRALTLAPRHARGLCALADWHYTMGRHGFLPAEESFAKGRELIFEALAADDRVSEVHDSLGKLALYYDDDSYGAARHSDRAIALNPNEPEALRFQSVVYKILGRTEDAVRIARAATTRGADMPGIWNGLGDALMAAGRNAEAIDALKRAMALQPGYGPALERLELAHARLGELALALEVRGVRHRMAGRRERADQLQQDAQELDPGPARERDLVRELDELLEKTRTGNPFEPFYNARTTADQIVVTSAALGQWEQAMDWVQRAYDYRPIRLRRMLTDPPFDRRGLAVDPRYARLLRVAMMEELL